MDELTDRTLKASHGTWSYKRVVVSGIYLQEKELVQCKNNNLLDTYTDGSLRNSSLDARRVVDHTASL